MTAGLAPVVLGPNFPSQNYGGGGRIASFRGIDLESAPSPEDWVGSTTSRLELAPEGLSRLADGRYLKDAVEADPEGYLGSAHVAAFGTDVGLLVKLLDSAERLVVHVHPDRSFASQHLGCVHGKTEAWLVLEAREGAEVYLAFRSDVSREQLDTWVSEQQVDEMLGRLHVIPVQAGSAVLVPAGLPHAIGDGVLILELQEPTDFSVMLEQRQRGAGDLGLGFDVVLDCVERTAWSDERLGRLSGPGLGARGRVLPPAADPFFRAERVLASDGGDLEPGFAVLVVLGGSGSLEGEFAGDALSLERGMTVLLPHAAGPVRITGDLDVIACRPPAADAPRPARPEV
ncbi:MAG: hypothetical protein JWM85_1608 [Acidimicrobiaceae bacterium]|nr:hypothetical protein [Acidimicrobiaceae bacterium]